MDLWAPRNASRSADEYQLHHVGHCHRASPQSPIIWWIVVQAPPEGLTGQLGRNDHQEGLTSRRAVLSEVLELASSSRSCWSSCEKCMRFATPSASSQRVPADATIHCLATFRHRIGNVHSTRCAQTTTSQTQPGLSSKGSRSIPSPRQQSALEGDPKQDAACPPCRQSRFGSRRRRSPPQDAAPGPAPRPLGIPVPACLVARPVPLRLRPAGRDRARCGRFNPSTSDRDNVTAITQRG